MFTCCVHMYAIILYVRNAHKIYLIVKLEGKTPLEKIMSRWEDTIQMHHKEKGRENVKWIWLRMGTMMGLREHDNDHSAYTKTRNNLVSWLTLKMLKKYMGKCGTNTHRVAFVQAIGLRSFISLKNLLLACFVTTKKPRCKMYRITVRKYNSQITVLTTNRTMLPPLLCLLHFQPLKMSPFINIYE